MEIILYKFNKRINSTKLPNENDIILTTEVVIKEATSVDTPSFILGGNVDISSIWRANYVKFENSYYWISDIRQVRTKLIEIDCKIDVLATYKGDILKTKAFVIYSSSAGTVKVFDNRNMSTINWEYIDIPKKTSKFYENTENGCYIVNVVNGIPSSSNNSTASYILNSTQMSNFCQAMYTDYNFLQNILVYISNPSNLILSVYYYPIGYKTMVSMFNAELSALYVGDFLAIEGTLRITKQKYTESSELLDFDLSGYINNDYSYSNNNMQSKCYLPSIGLVDFDIAPVLEERHLLIRTSVDFYTGVIMYELLAKQGLNSYKIATYTAQYGVPTPLGASFMNMQGLVAGLGGSVAAGIMGGTGFALGNPLVLTGGVAGLVTSQVQALTSMRRENNIIGHQGSRVEYAWNTEVQVILCRNVLADSLTAKRDILGLVYGSSVELSTLTGYCQCSGASVSTVAMNNEIEEINTYLNGGFYIE